MDGWVSYKPAQAEVNLIEQSLFLALDTIHKKNPLQYYLFMIRLFAQLSQSLLSSYQQSLFHQANGRVMD